MSQAVFTAGLNLAKAFDAQILLLHVLSPEAPESPISYAPYDTANLKAIEEAWNQYRKESLAALQAWAERAREQGVNAEIKQVAGNPAPSIVGIGHDWGADLIAMGRRGHSNWKEIVLGSVSSYVIHRSHCSIHLVQT